MKIEWTDRYTALGIPYPDPETVCKGDCEGVGVYPQEQSDGEYEFIQCELCGGTGKRI